MEINIHILFKELEAYQPVLYSEENYELKLDHARIVLDESDFDYKEQTIYIIEGSLFRTFNCPPKNYTFIVVDRDDNQDNLKLKNGMRISRNLSLSLIGEHIHNIFKKYLNWEQEIIQICSQKRNKYVDPIQKALKIGTKMLQNPIALFDISSALLFYEGEMPKDVSNSIWEGVLSQRRYTNHGLTESEQKIMYESLLNDHQDNPSHLQYYKGEEDIAYAVLFSCKKPFATLGMAGVMSPITPEQYSVFYIFKKILEKLNVQNQLFHRKDGFPPYLIEALLNKEEIEDFVLTYHLSRRSWQIHDQYCVLNITSEQGHHLTGVEEATILQRLKEYLPETISHVYENYIIIIMHSRHPLNEHQHLKQFLEQNELYCAVSPNFYSFQHLRYAYIQTKYLLQVQNLKNHQQRIVHFEDYYDDILLFELEKNTSLKSLCHPKLLDLISKSEIGTESLNMLKTYLLNGQNTLATAKKLQIHRNTLSYRIEKIERQIEVRLSELNNMETFWILVTCIILSR